jgi:phage tail-like protein
MAAELSDHPAWMGHAYDERLGTLHRFKVQVGKYNLGGWSKVSGLKVEFKLKPVPQAGFNTYTAKLLQQPDWDPIVLERVIIGSSSEWQLTYEYLADALANPQQQSASSWVPVRASSTTALIIQVNSAWGDPVRKLQFMNARPYKWEGPQLSAASTTSVATEKLTFIHDGFFPDGTLED